MLSFFLRDVLVEILDLTSYARPHSVFDIGTVRLCTVMPEVYCWLTNEKQRNTDIRLTDQ